MAAWGGGKQEEGGPRGKGVARARKRGVATSWAQGGKPTLPYCFFYLINSYLIV